MQQKTIRHWLTVIACCGLAASSIGICTNAMGVFYTPVSEALGVGRGTFALHTTITLLTSGFFSLLVARLLRRYRYRPLLLTGVLLTCATTALMSCTKSIWVFYLLSFFRGVGMSCFSLMPVTAIITNWVEARHGLAMGITLSFSGLSGAVFNPLFTWLISLAGWQTAYLLMALFALLLAVLGILLLRFSPSEIGLTPYGANAEPHVKPAAPQSGAGWRLTASISACSPP